MGCKNLSNVVIPASVKAIYGGAFRSCESLTSIFIPDSVTHIGDTAFADCKSLAAITVDENNKYYSNDEYGVLFNKEKTELIQYPAGNSNTRYVIPNGTSSLTQDSFDRCENLTKLVIPDSIKHIEESVFGGGLKITDIYYNGNENQWEQIVIERLNDRLSNTKIHFNHSHIYVPSLTLPPCMVQNNVVFMCECGDNYVGDYIDTTNEHVYSSKVTIFATHLKEGIETFTCECGKTYTETIEKIPHSYDKIVTAPTCTEQGYTTYSCQCGYSYVADYVKANGHSHTPEVTTPATHTSSGVMTYTCICGNSYTQIIPKLDDEHSYTSEITKQPTHKETGIKTFTCKCGDSYTEPVAKIPHSYNKAVTAPTCTKQGYTTFTCECGDSYVGDYVGTKPHNYDSTVTRPATHFSEGVRTYTCSSCGGSYTEAIAKTSEHSYSVVKVVEPTCEAEGYTTYKCECGHTYNGDKKSAKGHNYDGDNCKVCGESKIENCSCNCHKGGIAGFFWKITNFFNKLFKTKKTCGCGVSHY